MGTDKVWIFIKKEKGANIYKVNDLYVMTKREFDNFYGFRNRQEEYASYEEALAAV